MKKMYFLTDKVEKVEAEMFNRNYRGQSSFHNGIDYVRYRVGKKPWKQVSLRTFNETVSKELENNSWIESNKETMEMLGI